MKPSTVDVIAILLMFLVIAMGLMFAGYEIAGLLFG